MKQNNCQGCGCINKDQCICMKEEYEDKFTIRHRAGVDITFNSWEEYNKYKVYENKLRKEYCDDAYKSGVKYVMALKQEVIKRQDESDKNKSQSKLELPNPIEVKVKVNNVDEFIKIWDVLYPKK